MDGDLYPAFSSGVNVLFVAQLDSATVQFVALVSVTAKTLIAFFGAVDQFQLQ